MRGTLTNAPLAFTREERFRLTTSKSAGEAKAAYTDWISDIEGRIASLRLVAMGESRELSRRQIDELAGRWYGWFIQQHGRIDFTTHPPAFACWPVVTQIDHPG